MFWFSVGGANDAPVQFSSENDLFGTGIAINVATGPGSVVTFTGADVNTGAPLYFQYGGEELDILSRGTITFTVANPISTNKPGFVPGAMWIEALGVYEVEVVVDGEFQGSARFAFCRSNFYGPRGRPS